MSADLEFARIDFKDGSSIEIRTDWRSSVIHLFYAVEQMTKGGQVKYADIYVDTSIIRRYIKATCSDEVGILSFDEEGQSEFIGVLGKDIKYTKLDYVMGVN